MNAHKFYIFSKIIFICLVMNSDVPIGAQSDYPYPALSPRGTLSQTVGNAQIQITYERPSARQRVVFGSLVPWNKVWRTGAGYCTKISFDQPVVVGSQPIKAGTYALLSIPNPDAWIMILNQDTSLYGSYNYQAQLDVARFVVEPQNSDRYYETLTFDIELLDNNARIYLSWANTQLSFEVKTNTDETIEAFIEAELLSGRSDNTDLYAGAAEYYYYRRTNYSTALKLLEKAIELNAENAWARDLKISIYERLQWYDLAIKEIKVAIEQTKNYPSEKEQDRMKELEVLENRIKDIHRKINK